MAEKANPAMLDTRAAIKIAVITSISGCALSETVARAAHAHSAARGTSHLPETGKNASPFWRDSMIFFFGEIAAPGDDIGTRFSS